jgi:hypothetical protein
MTLVFQPNQILTAEQLNQAFSDATSSATSLATQLAAPTGSSLVGFEQPLPGAVPRTAQSKLQESVTVEDFGAVGDGVTDDYPAFLAALVSGAPLVRAGAKTYRMTSGITIPAGVELRGAAMLPGSGGGLSTVLTFASNVAVCVDLNGSIAGTGGGTGAFRLASVTRTGTPPAGSIGVRVRGMWNSILEDIYSYNHAENYHWMGHGGSSDNTLSNGLACTASRIYSSGATENHFVVDSWAELRVTGGRAGVIGSLDQVCTSFIKITSPTGGSGGAGPNTIIFENYQFNQGVAGPSNWVNFVNNLAAAGNQTLFQFTNCHVENITGAYLASDAASNFLTKLTCTGVTFNTSVPMFALNSATSINGVKFTGCDISASTFAPSVTHVNAMQMTGNNFAGCAATFNAPAAANWTVASSGNTWANGSSVTVTGSGWFDGKFFDSYSFDSTFTDTSGTSAIMYSNPNQALKTWTPGVTFGGTNVGMTFSSQIGYYQVSGREITCYYSFTMTAKGTSTGLAKLTGLPFPPLAGIGSSGVGPLFASGLASITGPVITSVAGGTQTSNFFQGSASGVATMADTNFTNAAAIAGKFSYLV